MNHRFRTALAASMTLALMSLLGCGGDPSRTVSEGYGLDPHGASYGIAIDPDGRTSSAGVQIDGNGRTASTGSCIDPQGGDSGDGGGAMDPNG